MRNRDKSVGHGPSRAVRGWAAGRDSQYADAEVIHVRLPGGAVGER
jgi:hypothetical protein